MKKFLAILLLSSMALTLVACTTIGASEGTPEVTTPEPDLSTQAIVTTAETTEETTVAETTEETTALPYIINYYAEPMEYSGEEITYTAWDIGAEPYVLSDEEKAALLDVLNNGKWLKYMLKTMGDGAIEFSDSDTCIYYYRDSDGTIIFNDCGNDRHLYYPEKDFSPELFYENNN